MIKNLLLVFTAFALTSCGYGKVRSIIDFTPKLRSETSSHPVILDAAAPAQEWSEGVNWINSQPENFAINETPSKFTKKASYKNMMVAPVIADGRIFILSDNATLSAIDAKTYKLLWSHALNTKSDSKSFEGGGLLAKGGKIFVTHGTREITVLDASDGSELWRRTLPDLSRSQPVLYNNLLLVLTISNQLCALDASSGQIIWEHDGLPEVLSYGKGVAPVVHNGRVLVCYSSGELVILDALNGQELWQLNLARDNDGLPGFSALGLESQPILDGDNVYIASSSNVLMKLNIATGQTVWKRKLSDIQSMNKSGNTLFITTNAKQVAAINASNGMVVWATDLSIEGAKAAKSNKPVNYLTPVVTNGQLMIFASDGKMRILSPNTGLVEKVVDIDKNALFITVDDNVMVYTKTSLLKKKA